MKLVLRMHNVDRHQIFLYGIAPCCYSTQLWYTVFMFVALTNSIVTETSLLDEIEFKSCFCSAIHLGYFRIEHTLSSLYIIEYLQLQFNKHIII